MSNFRNPEENEFFRDADKIKALRFGGGPFALTDDG